MSTPAAVSYGERARGWLAPLNLHLAGVAVLALVNVYLVVQLVVLWQRTTSNNQAAVAQQELLLRTAELGAEPLRGLDAKLAQATNEADRFYAERLPRTDSEVLAELGALTKEHSVRLTRGQYAHAPVLAGTPGELTEMRIDASLSGDYRQLVQVINGLERDRMFFVIDALTLAGQQTGTVNLRVRLRTFLRGRVPPDEAVASSDEAAAGADTAPGGRAVVQPGGAMRFVGAAGSEERKKFLAVCGFAALVAGYLYFQFGDSGSAPVAVTSAPVVAPAPVRGATATGPAAKTIGTTSAGLDPTLHMAGMLRAESVVYEGSGRNIFSATYEAPVVIQKPIAPARPVNTVAVMPVAPVGPPPPPPIDLKFAGYFVSKDGSDRRAVIVHGDDVVLAHAGDIVLRRYKVVSISASSIQVEDMSYNNKQTLPLIN